MKSAEEFLEQLVTKTPYVGNDVIEAMKEYAKAAIKEDRKNIAEHAVTKDIYEPSCDDHTPFWGACISCGSYSVHDVLVGSVVDKDSIINAPLIELK